MRWNLKSSKASFAIGAIILSAGAIASCAGPPNTSGPAEQTAATSTGPAPGLSSTAPPLSAIVGDVPGNPQAAPALQAWIDDLVSHSTADLAAKCWTIAPQRSTTMYADKRAILNAVAQPGVDGQFGIMWQDGTTNVAVRRSEIRSGYACPYVHADTAGNHLAPADAEYIVHRYLSRMIGAPVNPADTEANYQLECSTLDRYNLLGKVSSFEPASIRSNGDLDSPVVTVHVKRAGNEGDIDIELSGGIYGSDSVYCIAGST